MRFFIGLLIGIGAALGAAVIWDHYASESATDPVAIDKREAVAQSVIDPLPPSPTVPDPAPTTTPPPPPTSITRANRPEPEAIPAAFAVATPPRATDRDDRPEPASIETRSMDLAPARRAAAWTPFHSRASARGFARHLNEKTGVDFTIVKEGPGHYEVVFEYTNDAERLAIESRIASAAGTEATHDSLESSHESNS